MPRLEYSIPQHALRDNGMITLLGHLAWSREQFRGSPMRSQTQTRPAAGLKMLVKVV